MADSRRGPGPGGRKYQPSPPDQPFSKPLPNRVKQPQNGPAQSSSQHGTSQLNSAGTAHREVANGMSEAERGALRDRQRLAREEQRRQDNYSKSSPSSGQAPKIMVGRGNPDFKETGLINDSDHRTEIAKAYCPPDRSPPQVWLKGKELEDKNILQIDENDFEFPVRPGYGSVGIPVTLRTNCFELRLSEDMIIFSESFDDARPGVATDYDKVCLTAIQPEKLPNKVGESVEIVITYITPHEGIKHPNARIYKLMVTYAGSFAMSEFLEYVNNPKQLTNLNFATRQQTLQEIQSILIRSASTNLSNVTGTKSTKFFPWQGLTRETCRLSIGVVALKGYYIASCSTIGRLLANVNVTTSAFYEHGNLAEIMKDFINQEGSKVGPMLLKWLEKLHVLRTDTKKVKVVYGLSRLDATQFLMEVDEKDSINGRTRISVQEHFQHNHSITLKNSNLPLVDVGSALGTTPCYLPAEILDVIPGQLYCKDLGDAQEKMSKFSARPPAANAGRIDYTIKHILGLHPQLDVLKNFGIKLDPNMVAVKGRIPPPPKIQYKGHQQVVAADGEWAIGESKLLMGMSMNNWALLHIYTHASSQERADIQGLPNKLKSAFEGCGMSMSAPHKPKPGIGHELQLTASSDLGNENLLKNKLTELRSVGIKFLVVILPSNADFIRSRLKYWSENVFGIHTVGFKAQTIRNKKTQRKIMKDASLKANSKLGGTNHSLSHRDLGFLKEKRTMVVGIDVTHPPAGSMQQTRSLAAMVASKDHHFMQYPASLRLQTGGQEMVDDIQSMFEERLELWQRTNGALPERIIIYRDGVSNSQYKQVLEYELEAINKGRQKNYGKIESELVFIIVGKGHQIRFYPTVDGDSKLMDTRTGNCKNGTVVGQGITTEKGWDFYIQPHTSCQGTARPAHCVVLYNEANAQLTADKLEQMTHNLCYLFARANKAVSLPPPVYYADLACTCGMLYLKKYLSEHTSKDIFDINRCGFQSVHDDLKDSMFYL